MGNSAVEDGESSTWTGGLAAMGVGDEEEGPSKQKTQPRQWRRGLHLHGRCRKQQAGCALAEV